MSKNQDTLKTASQLNEELQLAIWGMYTEQAESLIQAGAEVNSINNSFSPLYLAINTHNFEFAKKLITTYGAKISPEILQKAVIVDNVDMVKFLLKNSDTDQKTIVDILLNSYSSSEEVFEILINKIIDINSLTVKIQDGTEVNLLEAAIRQDNSKLVQALVASGAKVTMHYYEIAERSYVNINSTLLEAEFKNDNSPNKQEYLSKAIKYNAKLAEKLLSEGVKIDLTNIMPNLATAIQNNNIQVINVLLNIPFLNINWNEPIGSEGDSLLMLIAKTDTSLLKNYITLKDKEGFPIFKINYENKNGEKLIDIVKGKISLYNYEEMMQIINLLRECGSVEPKEPIIPQSAPIDADNVHNPLNESLVKRKQKELHNKYSSQDLDKDIILQEIEMNLLNFLSQAQHIAENHEEAQRLCKDLTEQNYPNTLPLYEMVMVFISEPQFFEIVQEYINLLRDPSIHFEHNNSWHIDQELIHVFLECKDHPYKMEKFLVNLARSLGGNWATLVRTYKALEEGTLDTLQHQPITDFDKFIREKMPETLGEQVIGFLQKEGIADQKIHEILLEFFNDLLSTKSAADYSPSTQLVKGLFFKAFKDLMTENGKDVSDLYTLDAKNFHNSIITMLDAFNYEDQEDYNMFYKFLANINLPNVNSTDSSKDYSQEEKILENIFSNGEIIKNLTLCINQVLEDDADLWCAEQGYGSKHNEYGSLIHDKPDFINISIYNSNKDKYKSEVKSHHEKLIFKLCTMAQKGYDNIATLKEEDAYCGIKSSFFGVISNQNNFEIDYNSLNIDYVIGEFFYRSLNYFEGINNFGVDNQFANNYAIRSLLEYANQQINPDLFSHHELGLPGDNLDYDLNS